jgi:hypothetical protein
MSVKLAGDRTMTHNLIRGTTIVAAVILFAASRPALAFNPQPEPPGRWSIEGYIDLTATEYEPTIPGSLPFGLSSGILDPGGQPAFTAAVRGQFSAPGAASPPAGRYLGTFDVFRLQIGNAMWNTKDAAALAFELMSGNTHVYVTGNTMLSDRPNLQLNLPASPGTWSALDVVDGAIRGRIGGTYTLRDGVVPEPSAVLLAAFGLVRRPRSLRQSRQGNWHFDD